MNCSKSNDALSYLHRALEIRRCTTCDADADTQIATVFYDIGRCHIELHQPKDALNYQDRALEIFTNPALKSNMNKNIACTLHEKGRCCIDLKKYYDALGFLNHALKLKKSYTKSADTDTVDALLKPFMSLVTVTFVWSSMTLL